MDLAHLFFEDGNNEVNDMQERGLPLPVERVQALQRGATQFRFPVKPQPGGNNRIPVKGRKGIVVNIRDPQAVEQCPYGQPGDRLWVKETWGTGTRPDPFEGWRDGIEYKADEAYLDEHDLLPLYSECVPDNVCLADFKTGWRSSIHMPRWASRYLLEVVSVRLERVKAITAAECYTEGITEKAFLTRQGQTRTGYSWGWNEIGNLSRFAGGIFSHNNKQPLMAEDICLGSPQSAFGNLWDHLFAAKGFEFDSNPWAWVVEHRRIEA